MCSRLIWNYVVYSKLYHISFGFFGSIDALNVSNAYSLKNEEPDSKYIFMLTTYNIRYMYTC